MCILLVTRMHSEKTCKLLVVITFSHLNMQHGTLNQKLDTEYQTYTGNSKCYVELFVSSCSSQTHALRIAFLFCPY